MLPALSRVAGCASFLTAVIAMLLVTAPAIGADLRWLFSHSVNYSRGDYGTGQETNLVYAAFTMGATPTDRLALSLTIPWVLQTSQTVTMTGGGVAVRKENLRLLSTSPGRVTRIEEGLGDIVVRGQYVLLAEKEVSPEVSPYVQIKFPTADDDRGLGTGKYDETLGIDLSKTVLLGLVGHASFAYTFIGSPPGADLRDSFAWSIGARYPLPPIPPLIAFTLLTGSTAISPRQANPLDLLFGLEYKLTKGLRVGGSVGKGLSEGSADFSVAGSFVARF